MGFQKEALLGCNKYSFCKTPLQGKFLDKKMTGERNKNLFDEEAKDEHDDEKELGDGDADDAADEEADDEDDEVAQPVKKEEV